MKDKIEHLTPGKDPNHTHDDNCDHVVNFMLQKKDELAKKTAAKMKAIFEAAIKKKKDEKAMEAYFLRLTIDI